MKDNKFRQAAETYLMGAEGSKVKMVESAKTHGILAIAAAIVYLADVMYKNGRHDNE